ncbi:MAG: diguanylate cyclase [Roseibium sp.]|nr:diguanylate cyclase [Roseibium sp.]
MTKRVSVVEKTTSFRTPQKGDEITSDAELFSNLIAKHCTDSIVFTDPAGLTLWANTPFSIMTGYALEEIVGKKPGAVLQGPDTDPKTVADIRRALAAQKRIRTEILNYTRQGDPYWIDLTITPVHDSHGNLTHFMSIERDISDRKNHTEETEKSLLVEFERRRERKILSQMAEWLFAARSQAELQDIVAKSMDRMFPGTSGAFFVYSNSRDILKRVSHWGNPCSTSHLHANECWSLRKGRAYSYGTTEIYFSCEHAEDIDHVYFCLPIIAHGETIGMMHISFPDHPINETDCERLKDALTATWELSLICAEQVSLATANVKLQDELQQRSVKDTLTGLWNRRWFNETASREVQRANESGASLCLASIDIDHFKKFNDTFGHDAGDVVLKAFGVAMQEQFTGSWFPCRMGGEEFCVLCCAVSPEDVLSQLHELRKALAQGNLIYDGKKLPAVAFSSGVSVLETAEDLTSFIKRSDEALYESKMAGRNRDTVAAEPA